MTEGERKILTEIGTLGDLDISCADCSKCGTLIKKIRFLAKNPEYYDGQRRALLDIFAEYEGSGSCSQANDGVTLYCELLCEMIKNLLEEKYTVDQ